MTLNGHTAVVNSVGFSPTAKLVVTASADQNAIIWNSGDGHEVGTLKGHTAWVYSASFSPDGKVRADGQRRRNRPPVGCRQQQGSRPLRGAWRWHSRR